MGYGLQGGFVLLWDSLCPVKWAFFVIWCCKICGEMQTSFFFFPVVVGSAEMCRCPFSLPFFCMVCRLVQVSLIFFFSFLYSQWIAACVPFFLFSLHGLGTRASGFFSILFPGLLTWVGLLKRWNESIEQLPVLFHWWCHPTWFFWQVNGRFSLGQRIETEMAWRHHDV